VEGEGSQSEVVDAGAIRKGVVGSAEVICRVVEVAAEAIHRLVSAAGSIS